jgi:osmotically-inducible protein OsmY
MGPTPTTCPAGLKLASDRFHVLQTDGRASRAASFCVSRVRNELVVHPASRSDEQVLADIRSNLESDAMLDGQTIKVTVTGGTAILSGELISNAVKYHALRVVSRVVGVREITNNLKVAKADPISDEIIKEHIVERMAANAMTRPIARQIEVAVNQGEVVLSGSVTRWVEALEAGRIARATSGVRAVKNQLQRGR